MKTLINVDHTSGTYDVLEYVQKSVISRKPFALKTDDPKLIKKERIGVPYLYFFPIELVGLNDKRWLVALEGYGSELIDLESPRPITFEYLGLTPSTSRLICNKLRSIGDQNECKE